MADRFPLIANTSANQIQELASGDTLNLTGNNITGAGIVTATTGSFTGNVSAATGSFTGNVSVGGTLTYEDVTNIDSVGIVTAQSGAHFDGGVLREKINIVSGKLSANLDINLDNGMVHYFTTTEDAQSEPNIKSAAGINTAMAVGDTASVTIITTAAAAGYGTTIKIDGAETGAVNWVGGAAPSTGGSSGLDIYSYQIIKTADSTFTVIGNLTNAASA